MPPLGRALGRIAFRAMRRYRLVALENLSRCYPEWSEEEIARVARSSFEHMGMTLVEFFLRQPRLSLEKLEQLVGFAGREHYEAAFREGRGAILVSAHYGNWELMGPRLTRAGYAVSAVSRTADDPGMERAIEAIRTRCGLRQIPRRQAARQGLAALRRNEILAILVDQNTAEGGVFVPFFGRPASTATGAAQFAVATGAPIIPTFCTRNPGGGYTMQAREPIRPATRVPDRAAEILRLTAALTLAVEQQVRSHPEQWCWFHNRWKHRPETGRQPSVGEAVA